MDQGIDKELWKGNARDIAFRSPFSPETNALRKKVFFISAIIIVHNAFPIDMANSHVLGVTFESSSAPSISGILGLFLCYLAPVLSVHSYQEVYSWLSQANSVKFANARKNIHNIYAHHQNIDKTLGAIDREIGNHRDLAEKIKNFDFGDEDIATIVKNHMSEMGSHVESFKSFVKHLKDSNNKFGEEINDAFTDYRTATSQYRSAMRGQFLRVGALELALPAAVLFVALFLCLGEVFEIVAYVFKAI